MRWVTDEDRSREATRKRARNMRWAARLRRIASWLESSHVK